jgi:hypothetical protein
VGRGTLNTVVMPAAVFPCWVGAARCPVPGRGGAYSSSATGHPNQCPFVSMRFFRLLLRNGCPSKAGGCSLTGGNSSTTDLKRSLVSWQLKPAPAGQGAPQLDFARLGPIRFGRVEPNSLVRVWPQQVSPGCG